MDQRVSRISLSWQSSISLWRYHSPVPQPHFSKFHASFGVFESWVCACMCVCVHAHIRVHVCMFVCLCPYTSKGKRLGNRFECKACSSSLVIKQSFLALFWTTPLQDKSSQEGPSQLVPNDFWFSCRDTAITCAITTLDYCVLNGPEVQIKYWISRKKSGSVLKIRMWNDDFMEEVQFLKQRHMEPFEMP